MSDYHNLLFSIRSRVCDNRNMSHSAYYAGSPQDNQIRNRAAAVFVLEMVLHQHRAKYGTIFNPLERKAALNHLIFVKTKWAPQDIKSLSFEDALFVIQDELRIDNINEEAQAALSAFNLPAHSYHFEDFPEADWAQKENSMFLQNLMMKDAQA
ncbi:hypothetical protein SRABI13_01688 [Erwinia aphidicola]|nr:hypothetical protein SRABI13_01688 [Erwinia aphidicola]